MYEDVISKEDSDVLEGCSEDSAADINAILDFLERLQLKVDRITENFPKKALTLCLKVIARINCLMQEFDGVDLSEERVCDNGYTELIKNNGQARASRFLHWVCGTWTSNAALKASVLSYPLLKTAVNEYLSVSGPSEIDKMCPDHLAQQLLNVDLP